MKCLKMTCYADEIKDTFFILNLFTFFAKFRKLLLELPKLYPLFGKITLYLTAYWLQGLACLLV